MKQLFLSLFLCLAVVDTGKAQVPFIKDSCLQQLVSEALGQNTDVRTAQLTVEQADSVLRSAKLTYLPSVALSPSATLSKPQGLPIEKSYLLPITMDWELSLDGHQKYEKKIANARACEAKYLLDFAKVQLVAAVANCYYTLVMLDQQVAITKQSVSNQEASLNAMRAYKEVGRVTDLAVNETEAAFFNTKASLLELETQVRKTELALNLLLNRKSGMVRRSGWNDAQPFSVIADTAISLHLLSGRPDVMAAEQALAAACGNEGIAKAAFYPTLRISASAGWTNNIGEIVNPAKLLLQLIGSLTQPIFCRGTLKAQKDVAIAQRKQAEILFEKSLLVAGNEVKEALMERDAQEQKLPIRQKQVEASRLAFENCQLLQNYTQSVSYIDVLMAQNTYLSAQLLQTADWLLMQQAYINLYKALCPQL